MPWSFEEVCKFCTPEEREKMAWYLALLRARKTYESLRVSRFVSPEPSHKRCFTYCGDDICDCDLSPRYAEAPNAR